MTCPNSALDIGQFPKEVRQLWREKISKWFFWKVKKRWNEEGEWQKYSPFWPLTNRKLAKVVRLTKKSENERKKSRKARNNKPTNLIASFSSLLAIDRSCASWLNLKVNMGVVKYPKALTSFGVPDADQVLKLSPWCKKVNINKSTGGNQRRKEVTKNVCRTKKGIAKRKIGREKLTWSSSTLTQPRQNQPTPGQHPDICLHLSIFSCSASVRHPRYKPSLHQFKQPSNFHHRPFHCHAHYPRLHPSHRRVLTTSHHRHPKGASWRAYYLTSATFQLTRCTTAPRPATASKEPAQGEKAECARVEGVFLPLLASPFSPTLLLLLPTPTMAKSPNISPELHNPCQCIVLISCCRSYV